MKRKITAIILVVALVLALALPAASVGASNGPTVTLDVPEYVYRPVPFVATSTTTNDGTAYTNVRFNITVSGPEPFTGTRGDIFTITHLNGGTDTQGINDTFVLVGGDFVGFWGLAGGFPLPAPYSATSTFTIQMNDGSTAPVGIYDVTVELVQDPLGTPTTLATATDSFSLSAHLLAGLWHMDEGSGTTASDSSGNGNDGTLMGDASWAGSANAMFGDALSFDGDGDYVQLPASDTILNTDTFTIEAWFKTSLNHPAYGGAEGRIVNLHRMGTASTAVSLYVEHDKIALLYYTGTGHVYVKHTVNYHDGEWHHIAVTHDATTYRLYYDGEEVASQADAFGDFGTYPAYLGTYNSSGRFFDGAIDEVRIWNGALGDDAIQQSYELGGTQSAEDPDVVVQLKHKVLTSGEFVCFTSAFYLDRQDAGTPKTVDIYIMSASGERTIGDVDLRLVTPKKTLGSMDDSDYITDTHWDADVTNGTAVTKGKKSITSTSIHLYAELDTEERLGVNAQYLPWD